MRQHPAEGRPAPERERLAADAQLEEQEPLAGTIVSIEDLVGANVVSSDGTSRGSVVDVLASPPPALLVQGLIVGNRSWLERLRVATRLRGRFPEVAQIDVVPWADVERWDGLTVVVRAGARTHLVDVESGPTGRTEPGRTLERGAPGESVTDEPNVARERDHDDGAHAREDVPTPEAGAPEP